MEDNTILFRITLDQANALCEHFGKNIAELEEYEICALLDKLIDETC